MPAKQDQDRTRTSATLGFWAALLTGGLNIWYFVAFVLYLPILQVPWQGLAPFAASFQALPFLAWVVPCFFIAPAFLIMMTCLHAWTGGVKEPWSLLALVFAAVYAAILSANYYIQMTVVPHSLLNGTTDGLGLWLYAGPYPYTIPGALEGAGYFSMGMSLLFAAPVFSGGRLQQWVRWTFVGTGLIALVNPIDPLIRLPPVILFPALVAGGVLLTAAPVLLAIQFRRSVTAQRRESALLLSET
jgi:hypothetical protein